MSELFDLIYPNLYQRLLLNKRSYSGFCEDESINRFRRLAQQQQEKARSLQDEVCDQRTRGGGDWSTDSSLPNSFQGVLFLKELITLSKFMSFERR